MSRNLGKVASKICFGVILLLVIILLPFGVIYADNTGLNGEFTLKNGTNDDNISRSLSIDSKIICSNLENSVFQNSKGFAAQETSIKYNWQLVTINDGSQNVLSNVYGQDPSMRTISGKMMLPEGRTAPSGGISGQLIIFNSSYGSAHYQQFTITEGENDALFSFNVLENDPGTGYVINYSLNENVDDYVCHGYYSLSGTLPQYSYDSATKIDVSSGNAVNMDFILLEGHTISGTITLPSGMSAPAGGINGRIYASFNSNEVIYSHMESDSFAIAEGLTSISYSINVPINSSGEGYKVLYSLDQETNGFALSGYYSTTGMINNRGHEVATLIDVSLGSLPNINLSIIEAHVVSGILSLPAGMIAPSDGFDVYLIIYDELFWRSQEYSIPSGQTEISYSFNVPISTLGKGYTLFYNINKPDTCIIMTGYYSDSGTVVFSESAASVIDTSSGDCNNINLSILKGDRTISGTISLPEGMTADKDDIFVYISISQDDFSCVNGTYFIIKEGDTKVSYCIGALANEQGKGYTIKYLLSTVVSGCFNRGIYSTNGTVPDIAHKSGTLVDVSSGDMSDINLTILESRKISGTVSLPEGKEAPLGGIEGDIYINYIDINGDVYSCRVTNFTIAYGTTKTTYEIEVPINDPGTGYRAHYTMLTNIDEYYDYGYYSPTGTVPYMNSFLLDAGSDDLSNINFDIKYMPGSIEINGVSNINIPLSGFESFAYTAIVKDLVGMPIPHESVNWSLDQSTSGVTFLGSGLLTVYSTAQPAEIIIVATKGTVSNKYTITLNKVNSTITPTNAIFDKNTSKQNNIAVTMNLNGNTLSSIKTGVKTLVKNTDYTESGNSVVIIKSYLASLPVGNSILSFCFSSGNNVELSISVADSTISGGGGGGGLGGGGGPGGGGASADEKPVNGVKNIAPTYSPGSVTVDIPSDDYEKILDSAQPQNGIKNITININDAGVDGYNTNLPSWALTSAIKDTSILINTAIASFILPSNMFIDEGAKNAERIGINVSAADKSKMPTSVVEQIGDSPVIDLSVTINGVVKEWSNPAAPVTVSIPYTLKDGESGANITVFYIDSKGNLVNMQGIYNPDTKMVTFTTTHFSKYLARNNKVLFTDLAGYENYAVYIESMAAKGIINGVENNQYAPGKVLTRAEFSKLLVTMLQLEINNKDNIFTDVKATNWYAPYVNAAYKAGLIKGVGTNKFAPDDTITTQDAALILVRALNHKGVSMAEGIIPSIKDYEDISTYARDAVDFTVLKGVTPLDQEGRINPKGTVNRASAAQYIYNVFNFKY